MSVTAVGRVWPHPRLGWYANVDIDVPGSWITMENIHDYWRPTRRWAQRIARKLEQR
jgi:hypothetical protein